MSEHAMIKQFRSDLKAGAVSPTKAQSFDRWRLKQPEGSPDRAAADELWADYESRKGSISTGINRQDARVAPAPSGRGRGNFGNASQPEAATNAGAAPASSLGEAFHNPYTFIPFVSAGKAPAKAEPTPRTIDERDGERNRRTGVLEIHVETKSPLLTCAPIAKPTDDKHKEFAVLAIGKDVVVPATGMKGSLRSLATILTGSSMGYIDDEAWLVQARDNNLGPAGKSSPPGTPVQAFLGRVLTPGSGQRDGTIQLGETRLVPSPEFRSFLDEQRPGTKRAPRIFVDEGPTGYRMNAPEGKFIWEMKLSGRPINRKGKREGIFLAEEGNVVTVSKELWRAYQGRHRHGNFPTLKKNDLVWLEPKDPYATSIRSADDIKSIQWARWGKEGDALVDVLPSHLKPDANRTDNKVDTVTDLFGQIAADKNRGTSFAARIRFGNLIFRDSLDKVQRSVTLAPLCQPHPGCAAFYRVGDPDSIGNFAALPARGYKIYRNTKERGAQAPWLYAQQPVFEADGSPGAPKQKVNKTVDLLNEGQKGRLRIACRALSEAEFGLMLVLASVDWRVGGGKPFGLGHCKPQQVVWVKEDGSRETMSLPDPANLAAHPLLGPTLACFPALQAQVTMWLASQLPVEKLRYPRAVVRNNFKLSRGGHAWFQKHANPKKATPGERRARGLQTVHASDEFAQELGANRIAAQVLPLFDPKSPFADVLYGYDLVWEDGQQGQDRRTGFDRPSPYGKGSVRGGERSSGNTSQNRETREDERKDRNK